MTDTDPRSGKFATIVESADDFDELEAEFYREAEDLALQHTPATVTIEWTIEEVNR